MVNFSIPPAGVEGLPSGTVTFLFTDMEGSTRLLQQLGEAYTTLIADHDRLLREVWETHQGTVVGTQGDSFFVAFPSAVDALQAAIESQHVLALHPWPDGVKCGRRTRELLSVHKAIRSSLPSRARSM